MSVSDIGSAGIGAAAAISAAAALGGGAQIRVNSDVLVSQANEVRSLANDMKGRFQLLADTMNRTRYYWIGEAGEVHRNLYEKQKDDVDKMLRRLLEHPDDLLQIAQNYSSAENTNVLAAQSLPSDVIE